MEARFSTAREELNRKVEAHPEDASLLSALAIIVARLWAENNRPGHRGSKTSGGDAACF
jgi:Flp pilus assembly protein TadD